MLVRAAWALLGILAWPGIGHAAAPAAGQQAEAATESLGDRDKLTGDWGGLRTALGETGTEVTIEYIGEGFNVLSGGLRRGGSHEGRLELAIDSDLEKAAGWPGAAAHVKVFNIHNGGRNAADNVGSLADPSNIDALPTTRLFTAWLEQRLWDGRVSVRAGQLAADDEFFTSETAGGLVNGTFGWAGLLASNMTSGGPAYPVATPGMRLKYQPSDAWTAQAALFNGDPAGRHCNDEPQRCNRHGTRFSTGGGSLWMGELQYAVNQPAAAQPEVTHRGLSEPAGLPGVYKLGAWYSKGRFADQRYGLADNGGVVSVSDPGLTGPLEHRRNWGIYGIADQTVWKRGATSVNTFVRGGVSPSNRNLISYYVDGGVGVKGLLAGRPDDQLTLGVAYAKISRGAVAADRDAAAFNGSPNAARRSEIVYELSYRAQITPWWTLQPDIQYIVRPNGGQHPDDPGRSLGHAFVAGLRTTIAF